MEKFLSNSWVVSILSGIISGVLVFFITNTIDKRHQKKQLYDANTMLLNHLRGYVLDNGLPGKEIINAVKMSIAREYNVKYEDLLNIKSIIEELVKEIIGTIYISNDNKKVYINMLQKELENIDKTENDLSLEPSNSYKKSYSYSSAIAAVVSGIATFLMPWLLALVNGTDETFSIGITIPLKQTGLAIIFTAIIILSVKTINNNTKTQNKKRPEVLNRLTEDELNKPIKNNSDSQKKSG